MIDLTDKVILVTGASRGIGAVTARVLAGIGAQVILHAGRNREMADTLAADLGVDRCHVLTADLGDPGAGRGLWRAAVQWKGRIDVLVNNAGVYEAAGVEADDKDWDRVWQQTLQINLVAVADLCRDAIKHFAERHAEGDGGGAIINIASRAAFRGDGPDYPHYAASKGGVIALTRTIARGHAHQGVLAYAVAPGFVETDMAKQSLTPEGRADQVSLIPLGDLAPPEDVANVVAFLASGLAPHATGTTIDVNGASYVR